MRPARWPYHIMVLLLYRKAAYLRRIGPNEVMVEMTPFAAALGIRPKRVVGYLQELVRQGLIEQYDDAGGRQLRLRLRVPLVG